MTDTNDLLPMSITRKLDAWINKRLEEGQEVVSVGVHDYRITELFPMDWPRKRIAQSLRIYFKKRTRRWTVDYRENSHKYHVSIKIKEATAC